MLVVKVTGKPFKSNRKINTVKGETVNPYTGLPAFTFVEDESIVDQRTCREIAPDDKYAIQELSRYA